MRALRLQAGPKALANIRKNGLSPADVAVIPGAAGGPKALGIHGLDLMLFGEWLPKAPRVRDLIGASIGAWRFAAVCRGDVIAALKDFGDIYCGQKYPPKPTPRMVSESAHVNMRALVGGREERVLNDPNYRLHIIVMRGQRLLARQSGLRTPAGFAAAGLANAFGRKHLRIFAERFCFHDPRGLPPFLSDDRAGPASYQFDNFRTQVVALDPDNLHQALWATAAIPMVMEGVEDIPGAPPGTYWDGGIVDYHLHLPYHRADGITLYPHFTDKIVPGWLDKSLPWRKARGPWIENLVLLSPTKEYLASLPYGKLPDRKDFTRFGQDYDSRHRYWRQAMAESERMGEEFLKLVETGEIGARLEPL